MLSEQQFWQFALAWYERDGVSRACIELQDNLGINVNLILLLCWCEQQGRLVEREHIDKLTFALQHWHEQYTRPLRQLRRQLTLEDDADAGVKRAIFDAEMALERTEQRLLLRVFCQFDLVTRAECHNVQRYVATKEAKAVIQYAEQLATIVNPNHK